MNLSSSADIVEARLRGQQFARGVGFSRMDSTLIATVISELAHEFVAFGSSKLHMSEALQGARRGIEVQLSCEDARCAGTQPAGLDRMRTVLDDVDVRSQASGTTVTLRKLLPLKRDGRLRIVRATA